MNTGLRGQWEVSSNYQDNLSATYQCIGKAGDGGVRHGWKPRTRGAGSREPANPDDGSNLFNFDKLDAS